MGSVTLTETIELTIDVENVLESIAVRDLNTFLNRISELAVSGTEVSGISLQVRDEGDRVLSDGVTWSLLGSGSNLFTIHSTSGVISVSPRWRVGL